MGFLHMLSVNRELNQVVVAVHNKLHRLEDLINGHKGVTSANYYQVGSLISDIENDAKYMEQKVELLDHAEQVSLLLTWTNGRKYPWVQWYGFLLFCIKEAHSFVDGYESGVPAR